MELGNERDVREDQPNALKPDLRGWQIFFIVASAIIGEGIFSGFREAAEVAGPGGALLALVLVGINSICVMSCVSELVQLFPVPNAIVDYIGAFVDEDLAWACGIAYWIAWTAVFAALYLTAVNFATYWSISSLAQNAIFIIAPFIMLGINLLGVNVFGIVESIGGALKILLVIFTGIMMYWLNSIPPDSNRPSPINDGIEADPGVVTSKAAAIFWVIPLMSYSFIGVESVAVTAFEASDIRSLRGPSRHIAWVIFALYGFTLVAEFLVYSWVDPTKPYIYGDTSNMVVTPSSSKGEYLMAVRAAEMADQQTLANWLNAFYIFSVLSGANSGLYLASRTLYGLARNMKVKNNRGSKLFKRFSHTTDKTRVPALALCASAAIFFWLPFLNNLNNRDALELVLDTLEVTSSIMVMIVWAALCLAFIRFRKWYGLNRPYLADYPRLDRNSSSYGASTGLMFLQPGLAWFGLIFSLLVAIVFTTAGWWNGFSGQKFVQAWAAPLVILILWFGRKLWSRKTTPSEHIGWVYISGPKSSGASLLTTTLSHLECSIPDVEERRRGQFRRKYPFLFPARMRSRHAPGNGSVTGDNGENDGLSLELGCLRLRKRSRPPGGDGSTLGDAPVPVPRELSRDHSEQDMSENTAGGDADSMVRQPELGTPERLPRRPPNAGAATAERIQRRPVPSRLRDEGALEMQRPERAARREGAEEGVGEGEEPVPMVRVWRAETGGWEWEHPGGSPV